MLFLDTCENLSNGVLSLPMHPYLNEEIINNITSAVIEALEAFKNGYNDI